MEKDDHCEQNLLNRKTSFENKMDDLDISKIQLVNQESLMIDLQTTERNNDGRKMSFLNFQSVNYEK